MMEVLIVEDDEPTARLEQLSLTDSGLQARMVSRSQEAVALLRKEPFLAVVLDYCLPGDDPWSVLEAAKAAAPPIPVIFATGMGDETVAAEALHRGVKAYITKSDKGFRRLPELIKRAAQQAASEARISHIASLVDSSLEDCIFSETLKGVILTWNRGAENIFGYSAAEMVGRNVSVLAPADRVEEQSRALDCVKSGDCCRVETVRLRKDGRPIDVSVTVCPIKDPQGRSIGACDISRDVSNEKRTEALLLATLESTGDGILVVDRDGKIIRYNHRFLELWRMPKAIVERRDDRQALDFVLGQLEDPGAFMAKVTQLYADPEAMSYDTLRFKDGRVFERFSKPLRVGTDCAGRVWSFHDVTDRVRAEEALKANVEELRHLNEIMMNREERILELKEEVKTLRAGQDQPKPSGPEAGQWRH